jgi:hypothetical protein
LRCTQEDDNKNELPRTGEWKCKALEIKGDISYPTDDLTTMLEA